MVDYSTEDIVLLYLKERGDRGEPDKGFAVSDISEGIGVGKENMAERFTLLSALSNLKKDKLVEEEVQEVEEYNRERNVYHLTDEGDELATSLKESLEENKITVKNGDEKEVKIEEVDRYFDNTPVVNTLTRLTPENILYLGEGEVGKEFVNRKEELGVIENLISDVLNDGDGVSRTLFVSGEAGIGKTTLVNQARKKAVDEGYEVFVGRCQRDTTEPYMPFREAFTDYDEAVEILTDISQMDVEDTESLEAQRKAVFYDFAEHLEDIAREKPIFVFIDDMQWIDKATLDHFTYLIESVEEKVLFVGAYRPEDLSPDHPLIEAIDDIEADEQIDLDEFGVSETRGVIEWLLEKRNIPDGFVELVFRRTGGNPLFIKESVNQMLEEGTVDPDFGVYPDNEEEIAIPEQVQTAIEIRIQHLDDDPKKMLHLGSVMGEKFELDRLFRASDLEEPEILDYVDILVGSNIWDRTSEDSVGFVSGVVRDTVYGTINEESRKDLHRSVAESFEDEEIEKTERYATIAHHFSKSGDLEKALSYYIKAGEHAEDIYAHEDAITEYEKGLEIVEELEAEDERLEILEKIGDAYAIIGDYEEAEKYFQYVEENSDRVEDKQRMYRKMAQMEVNLSNFDKVIEYSEKGIELQRDEKVNDEVCRLYGKKGWGLMQKGDFDGAVDMFEKERELADSIGNRKVIAKSIHDLGTVSVKKGELGKATEHLEKAVELKEELSGKRSLSNSLNNLGLIYWKSGDLNSALEKIERGLEIQREIGDKMGASAALINLGVIHNSKANLDKALEYYEESLDVTEKIGDKRGLTILLGNIGIIHLRKGNIDRALEYGEESLEIAEEIGNMEGVSSTKNFLSEIYFYRDEIQKALDYVEEAVETAEEMGDEETMAGSMTQLGRIHRERSEYEKAVEANSRGVELGENGGYIEKEIYNRLELVEALIELGRLDEAVDVAEDGMEKAKKNSTPSMLVSSKIALGVCEREKENYDYSEKMLEEALETSIEIGDKKTEGKAVYELIRLYEEKGDVGESERYVQKLHELGNETGMEYFKRLARTVHD